MAWRIKWTEPAWDSVQRQAGYIARDSPRYAAALVRDVRQAARSLAQFPKRGRVVPEEENASIRELFVFHSYRLLYQVVEEDRVIRIIAFVHGSRELDNALSDHEET